MAADKVSKEELTPTSRAEDILLGSLGFGEDARVLEVERTPSGYKGRGVWQDGEEFSFESDDELDDLQIWALDILAPHSSSQ